jgi:hypothetical protein
MLHHRYTQYLSSAWRQTRTLKKAVQQAEARARQQQQQQQQQQEGGEEEQEQPVGEDPREEQGAGSSDSDSDGSSGDERTATATTAGQQRGSSSSRAHPESTGSKEQKGVALVQRARELGISLVQRQVNSTQIWSASYQAARETEGALWVENVKECWKANKLPEDEELGTLKKVWQCVPHMKCCCSATWVPAW